MVNGSEIKNTQAYIYYDVLNQYGESIRTSTSINWTVSSCDKSSVNKSTGIITAEKDKEAFTYGTLIYVTGVNVKNGVSVTTSVTVGMEQAVDTVEFAGFVSKNEKTKKVDNLPKNFAKDTWSLLYTTYDQNHCPMDAADDNVKPATGSARLTFISDNVLLVKSEFNDGEVYTIDGVEYSSVKIEPGMYVDKGGEVNITAISNKTGGKTIKNFVIGDNGLLQSLTLSTPSNAVADGDTDVEIPYVAKDANGNEIKNYETIVRSSNSLSLTASEGTLTVYEKADGTAGIKWTDANKYVIGYHKSPGSGFSPAANHIYYNPYDTATNKITIDDDVDRNVSLTTVVVGGQSDNMLLPVSDMRRPASISKVKLNGDDNNTIVSGGSARIDVYDSVTYFDQYGKELSFINKKAFWEQANKGTIGDYTYQLHATSSKKDMLGTNEMDGSNYYLNAKDAFNYNPDIAGNEVVPNTIKYTIQSKKSNEGWNDICKAKSELYNIVPLSAVSNFALDKVSTTLQMETEYSIDANGSNIKATTGAAFMGTDGADLTVTSTDVDANITVVRGTYKGLSVVIPRKYLNITSDTSAKKGSAFTFGNKGLVGYTDDYAMFIDKAKYGKVKWSDLYDFNTAKNTRKNATEKFEVNVTSGGAIGEEPLATISTNITLSDALRGPAKIEFQNSGVSFNPTNTEMKLNFPANGELYDIKDEEGKNICTNASHMYQWWANNDQLIVHVTDQYGKALSRDLAPVIYTVSNIKESTSEFTHASDSFTVKQNGSENTSITGAEIGDTFTLTATIQGTNISASINVTVGADTMANQKSGDAVKTSADYVLRTEKLGYDR